MKQAIKGYNREFTVIGIFLSVVLLSITTGCSCDKSLQKHCILKESQYQNFVQQHGLQQDVDDFLNQ
jgi:hypothetical protein